MSIKLIPYLIMDGNAGEAIQFYVEALEAKVLFSQSFGEMPANPEFPLPEEAKNRVGHATLQIGESSLMFSDTFPGQPYQAGNNITICVNTKDKETTQRLFDGLQQGGRIDAPLHATHFSSAYGVITDKFGITFQFFTESMA
ncbi:VOC family protein [Paenibacillus thalictri]|uniref:VOC family protein n=1 Tax=Paenibacillus thalictri TaxID=2527873 RepID=A0A4Q9DQ78_9BACL|nr:VOC family protein [Paenibacillus thalictri]TBL78576.1 VOC family protein [Paenibacillus thalictri]